MARSLAERGARRAAELTGCIHRDDVQPTREHERDVLAVGRPDGTVIAAGSGMPGMILDENLTVACGEGAVRLTEVQRAGKKPMSAADFLRGVPLRPGTLLE